MEVLSRSILEAKRLRQLRGFRIGEEVYMTHLLFFDNVLLFTNGSIEEGRNLKENLQLYSKTSNMDIKEHKSTISYFGINLDIDIDS